MGFQRTLGWWGRSQAHSWREDLNTDVVLFFSCCNATVFNFLKNTNYSLMNLCESLQSWLAEDMLNCICLPICKTNCLPHPIQDWLLHATQMWPQRIDLRHNRFSTSILIATEWCTFILNSTFTQWIRKDAGWIKLFEIHTKNVNLTRIFLCCLFRRWPVKDGMELLQIPEL